MDNYFFSSNVSASSPILTKELTHLVERRLIEVLETDGEQVLVRGTLKEGDAIITDGTQRLVSGQLVSI